LLLLADFKVRKVAKKRAKADYIKLFIGFTIVSNQQMTDAPSTGAQ